MGSRVQGLLRDSGFVILLLLSGCFSPLRDASSPTRTIALYPAEGTPQKLILFVHGAFGDPLTTWTNSTGESWPVIMRQDSDFREFDIGAVRYDTPFLQRTSGIEEIATRVLRQLEDEGVFKKYREVYFVSHSMGGLVVKRSLIKLGRAKEIQKLRQVKAVMYISTPAQGAELASLGRWLSANPQLYDMRPAELNTYLQGLENDWNDLLRDRGNDLFPRSYCAYETKLTFGTLIVNRVDALTGCDQNAHPVDEDHSSIVKPANMKADIYRWAKARIQEAGDLARGTPMRYALHRTPYKYKPGLIVEGLEWKEDYREYDLIVSNPSKTDYLIDVRLRFEFPWVVIASNVSFQQGTEGLALSGDVDSSFRYGTSRQIEKVIPYRTNLLRINANRLFPESTLHLRIILSTAGIKAEHAILTASYREGATAIKRSIAHRLAVLNENVGTIRIEAERNLLQLDNHAAGPTDTVSSTTTRTLMDCITSKSTSTSGA
jgi:pimeloyl-ACP methyl ester carboxylesterase